MRGTLRLKQPGELPDLPAWRNFSWQYRMAWRYGARLGLERVECASFAADFTCWMLLRRDRLGMPDARLRSIAWRMACNHARAVRRRRAHEAPLTAVEPALAESPFEDPEACVARNELLDLLIRLLEDLNPAQRELFLARCIDRESFAQIAARTGRSEGALRTSLANIRKRLQRNLDARGYTEAMICEILSPPVDDGARQTHCFRPGPGSKLVAIR